MDPETLTHNGIVLTAQWPRPDIAGFRTQFAFAYFRGWGLRGPASPPDPSTLVDVYVAPEHNHQQSIIVVDQWSASRSLWGSFPLDVLLDGAVNTRNLNHDWRTIVFGLLNTGAFRWRLKTI